MEQPKQSSNQLSTIKNLCVTFSVLFMLGAFILVLRALSYAESLEFGIMAINYLGTILLLMILFSLVLASYAILIKIKS
jgi:hypothetical protein